MQVDHVEVNRINTDVSNNLLVDPSFENQPLINIEIGPPATTTGSWIEFNNTFIEQNDVPPGNFIPTVSGDRSLKAFGPFLGTPDASGAFQNVAAQPGEEFEASVSAITVASDSILFLENFATLAISFLDENGNVLQEAFTDPGNLIDTNGRDFPLLDGRDPHLTEDQFVQGTVGAIAPTGTAFARVSLFFIQLDNEPGAVFYDDAALWRITAIPTFLEADFDVDVDVDDFLAWQGGFGTQLGATKSDGDFDNDGDVDGDDFLGWQSEFGSDSGLASARVPEPESSVLLFVVLVGAVLLVRRTLKIN